MPNIIAARVDNPTIGLVPPPPGVEPNFDHPYSRQGLMLGVNVIGLVLVVIFFCVRMWTRFRLTRYVGWDDYTCVFALVLVAVHSAGSLELSKHGLGIHAWDIRRSSFNREEAMKWAVIMFSISVATPGVIKISILLLYLRIFSSKRGMKLAIYASLCFTVSYLLALELSFAFSCKPVRKLLRPELPGRCLNAQAHGLACMILNIASDLLVFILPIPTSLALRIPKRQKFALLAVFLIGLISCVASGIKLYYFLKIAPPNQSDPTWGQWDITVWGVIEADLALICSCMPACKPFVGHFRLRWQSVFSKLRHQQFRSARSKGPASSHVNKSGMGHNGRFMDLDENYAPLPDPHPKRGFQESKS